MAGIGFELQRALRKGGLLTFIKVALAGIAIVAGPWIISIIGIFLIIQFVPLVLAEGQGLFMAVIIYSFAFSLFFFGGFHYIFTRYLSDLIYLKEKRRASALLLLVLVMTFLFSLATVVVPLIFLNLKEITHPLLFKVSAALLFVSINLTWILMIFISLLKKFFVIFFIYLSGMIISLLGTSYLASLWGGGGAILGFSAGQTFIVIGLLAMSLISYPSANPISEFLPFMRYFSRYRYLLFTGIFISAGVWVDKILFWFAWGQPVGGTFFRLFEPYDIAVYFSNLSMIPGLVYFMVVSETAFYAQLKLFLLKVEKQLFKAIQKEKYKILKKLTTALGEQSLFQGIISLSLIIMSPLLVAHLFNNLTSYVILNISLINAFLYLLLITLITFLFYFESYVMSFIASCCFFLINLVGAFIIIGTGGGSLFGLNYLVAALVGILIAGIYLFKAAKKIDRRIFA